MIHPARWGTAVYSDEDLLPISALQHLQFCRRRCALIHVDGQWTENVQTAEGRVLHRRVHEAPSETVKGVRVVRGLKLSSKRLGLFGVADVVEFHPADEAAGGVALAGLPGRWRPLPVEYKRGARKREISYFVQLCAQALCLEEMLGGSVPEGALYHGKSRRRQVVPLDGELRAWTEKLAGELRRLVAESRLPPPEPGPKCRFCSLAEKCVPKLPPSRSARTYVSRTIDELLADSG